MSQPFDFDSASLEKVVNVVRDVYEESISFAAQGLNTKIGPLVTKESTKFTVNTEELEMYKLTKKILERVDDIINPEDPHKMPKIKRIINWLIRGDFYGEWNQASDYVGDIGKFIPFIQKVFISVIKGIDNYDVTIEFTDVAKLHANTNTKGYRAEGNLVPVFKFARKAVPGWNIVLPGETKSAGLNASAKPKSFVPAKLTVKVPAAKPSVEELLAPTKTSKPASVWVEKASKPIKPSTEEVKLELPPLAETVQSLEVSKPEEIKSDEPLSPTKEIERLLDFDTPLPLNKAPVQVTQISQQLDTNYWCKVAEIAGILAREMVLKGVQVDNGTILEMAASAAPKVLELLGK